MDGFRRIVRRGVFVLIVPLLAATGCGSGLNVPAWFPPGPSTAFQFRDRSLSPEQIAAIVAAIRP